MKHPYQVNLNYLTKRHYTASLKQMKMVFDNLFSYLPLSLSQCQFKVKYPTNNKCYHQTKNFEFDGKLTQRLNHG